MLSAEQCSRVCVVLVGARNPGNVGATARAMQDFGFTDLRFVNTFAAPLEAARLASGQTSETAGEEEAKAAVGAGAVLAGARIFQSVAEAVADCTLVVGTTAIGGRTLTQPLEPLPAGVAAIRASLDKSNAERVALLFGSEKTGLTKDQLSHCTSLTTIPMFSPEGARHLSMNLGQAVAVCLYELVRDGFEGATAIPVQARAAATSEDRDRLTQLLLDVMHVTEYSRRFPANTKEPLVRALTQSLGNTHAEAESWMGILRQVLWSLRP